jgi:diguanylate cyclase (GGDEF)-like protein
VRGLKQIKPKTKRLSVKFQIIGLFLAYLLLPALLIYSAHRHFLSLLSVFYIVNLLIIFFLVNISFRRKSHLFIKIQDLQEKTNLQFEANTAEIKNKIALESMITRYGHLKGIVEELNQNLDLDTIAASIVTIVFTLIARNKGVCNLYLVDKHSHEKLRLFKSKKDDRRLVIKAKEGDIFDYWVLRHASPLLIEDIRKDFRFDLEKIAPAERRQILSLISVPVISENKFLGILRLDNPVSNFFTQYDLRLLANISDLAAVALENAQLFKETEELAIHDELTTLYTKGYFMERLKEECLRSIRHKNKFALLLLDIDFFKNYNDTLGHPAGDIVLRRLAGVILDSLTGLNPIISRFGGEEFCIILPNIDKKKARAVAEKLRVSVEKTRVVLRRQETAVTVSVGVAIFPDDAGDENELIMKSDSSMYAAKKKGRNKVVCA